MRLSLPASLLLAASLLAIAPATTLPAADLTPPFVFKPLPDLTVPAGTSSSTVKLKKTFALSGVTGSGPFVRFTTVRGNVDVALRPDVAPRTVTNFLNYVNRGAYNDTFIHRSPLNFVVQGGGFRFVNDNVETVAADPPVVNEFNLSNLRGTIAMAKLGSGPDTATSQWFFSVADNSANLDNQNGGFTVFGTVLANGMDTVDSISALPIYDFGSPFDQIPLINYTSGNVAKEQLVNLPSVAPISLVSKVVGVPGLLKLNVSANSNPGLVTTTISGQNLILSYTPGVTGSAEITVRAKNSARSKASDTFTVTVR